MLACARSWLINSSAELGVIIPPSIPMILYGVRAEISIGELFIAGFGPGIFIGLALMAFAYVYCKYKRWGKNDGDGRLSVGTATVKSGWALLMWEPIARELQIVQVQNHEGSLLIGATPIIAADGWEHAYYVDYRNDKAKWAESFTHMTNWAGAGERFDAVAMQSTTH